MSVNFHHIAALILIIFILSFSEVNAQVYGCTDPLANNYNTLATANDGSCTYPAANISEVKSWSLPASVIETSGLIQWNNNFWTHNDNSDLNLYELDTNNISNPVAHSLGGLTNIDWEEVSQDSQFIYIGDFGNNANGNRIDLRIYKIEKSSLLAGVPTVDTINFSYSLQTNRRKQHRFRL